MILRGGMTMPDHKHSANETDTQEKQELEAMMDAIIQENLPALEELAK